MIGPDPGMFCCFGNARARKKYVDQLQANSSFTKKIGDKIREKKAAFYYMQQDFLLELFGFLLVCMLFV